MARSSNSAPNDWETVMSLGAAQLMGDNLAAQLHASPVESLTGGQKFSGCADF